jgi:hypothetical protein
MLLVSIPIMLLTPCVSSQGRRLASERGVGAPPDANARVTLSAPTGSPYVWAASEWNVEVQNLSTRPLAFGPEILRDPQANVKLWFDVELEGQPPSRVDPDSYRTESHGGEAVGVLEAGAVGNLTATLHGENAWQRVETTDSGALEEWLFRPVFDQPGSYVVTAVLRWRKSEFRSNPVTLEVLAPPEAWTPALAGLKALAASGICPDVQAMLRENSMSELELLAAYAEHNTGTVYGAQTSLGLAVAYEAILRSDILVRCLSLAGGHVSLERVKQLHGPRPPTNFCMDQTWVALRDKIEKLSPSVESHHR